MLPYGAEALARSFRTVRDNTLAAAEEIPADQYDFRPAPECRTVEKLLTHIALGYRFQHQLHAVEGLDTLEGFDFFGLMGELAAEEEKPRTKEEVIALLEAEGARWEAFLGQVSDDFLSERVALPHEGPEASKGRLEMIMSVKEHEMHHRAQLFLMLRLMGQVPHLTRERQERFAAAAAAQSRAT